MTLQLREYQQECVEAVNTAWAEGNNRPAVVLPTGAGKTVVFSSLAVAEVNQHRRVLVLVHLDELVRQSAQKLVEVGHAMGTRQFSVTICKGAQKNWTGDVVVASVQTLSRVRTLEKIDRDAFDLVIVDECHLSSAPSYQRVLGWFGCLGPLSGPMAAPTRALGVTATFVRSDKRKLADTWPDVAFSRDLTWMIDEGHLVDVRAIRVRSGLDLSQVKVSQIAGEKDLAAGDVGRALEASDAFDALIRDYRRHGADPAAPRGVRRGIAFLPTVETAMVFADCLQAAGLRAATVVGSTPIHERQAAYAALRAQELDVLTSVGVLTTGFDLPAVEVMLAARPTMSKGLLTQMVGRVLRPSPATGKREALLLDLVGVTERGLASVTDLSPSKPKDGETLTEAREREALEGEAQAREIVWRLEEGESAEIDLFGRGKGGSKLAWLETPGGTRFLQVGERGAQSLVFVSERAPGEFVVARWDDGQRWPTRLHKSLGGLDLETARNVAEAAALDIPGYSPMRSASRRSKAPSEAQVAYAERLGVYRNSMNAGECGDAITIARVGQRLDGVVDHGRLSAGVVDAGVA
jgi:superfamily II DNA or RNA helicase